jgi:hypothetical protein
MATIIVFLFLNMLLALTYVVSLFAIRRENIMGGLRKNIKRLTKGLHASLHIQPRMPGPDVLHLFSGFFLNQLAQGALWLIAMNYGAGVIASLLLAIPLVWLLTSLAGGRLWIGFGRLLSTIALFFLMLAILSAYGLPGLFTDSVLISTAVSLIVPVGEKVLENKAQKNVKGISLEDCIEISKEIGDKEGEVATKGIMAIYYLALKDYYKALKFASDSLEIVKNV